MNGEIETLEEVKIVTQHLSEMAGHMITLVDYISPTAECEFRRGYLRLRIELEAALEKLDPETLADWRLGDAINGISSVWVCSCGTHTDDPIFDLLRMVTADMESEEE